MFKFAKDSEFKAIEKILTEKNLPDYGVFFDILTETLDVLENEDVSYRQKNDDGESGGLIDFKNDDKLTIVVPDLHARPDFLLNILNCKIKFLLSKGDFKTFLKKNPKIAKNLRVFDALKQNCARLVFVGDILHSEKNKLRWKKIEQEFENNIFTGKNICKEMGEGFSLLFALCKLKISFPQNVQILKGNHENILNKTENGDYAFRKFAEEGDMCRVFVQNYYGDDILYLIHCAEKNLPIVFAGKNVVVSHAEPASGFSKNQIVNANKFGEVTEGFTWTANGEAQDGSVETIIKNLFCDEISEFSKDKAENCENENGENKIENSENENREIKIGKIENPQSKKIEQNCVYLAGHRPVKGDFELRQGGKFIQFHNPDKQNVAVVFSEKKFNPNENIKCVERKSGANAN